MNMSIERIPVTGIEDKHVDAILAKKGNNVACTLAVMVLSEKRTDCKSNEVRSVEELTELIGFPEVQIECSILDLIDVGYLTNNQDYSKSE